VVAADINDCATTLDLINADGGHAPRLQTIAIDGATVML